MKSCRQSITGISVELFTQSNQLPVSWNDLLPADHFLQTKHLQVHESAMLPDLNFIYALISVHSKPVAAAYFQALEIKPYHLDDSGFSVVQKMGWQFFTKIFCPRLLVAGHLFRHDIASFYAKENLTDFDAYQAYQSAIESAKTYSHAQAVLVKDMPPQLAHYFQHYAKAFFLMRNDISMEMEIEDSWQTIHDYEKALKHKYAQRLRKIRSPWETLCIRELSIEDAERNAAVLFQLYNQVTEKQKVRLGKLSPEYLVALKKNYPDQLKNYWMAYEKENPVAFFSAWLKEGVFDMFYIGLDYARNEDLQLYFNILFFSVEQAILYRKQKLVLGRTALEAKARLGCKPHYLSTFLHIPNRIIAKRVMKAQSHIAQEGEWEKRHPLKNSKQ